MPYYRNSSFNRLISDQRFENYLKRKVVYNFKPCAIQDFYHKMKIDTATEADIKNIIEHKCLLSTTYIKNNIDKFRKIIQHKFTGNDSEDIKWLYEYLPVKKES